MSTAELLSREKNIAHLRVVLDSATVDRTYREFYKSLASQVNIPGFRKGKVPPNILRQRLGAEAIDADVADRLKEVAMDFGMEELNLTARMGRPSIESEPETREGQEAAYEFKLPVLPDVELPDYSAFKIEVTKLHVTDEMKKRYRERIIERFTDYPEREGGAGQGDMLVLDVHSHFKEGQEESPFHTHGMAYKIGEEGNLPGWDDKLLGAVAGQKVEFPYSMPEDFADSRIAGKELNIEIAVSSVHGVDVPELNEEFVTGKLQLESLQQFEEFMQSSLKRESEQQFEGLKRDKALQMLAEGLKAEITDDMVSDELDGIVSEHDRELRQHGLSLDAYLKQLGKSLTEFREERKDSAERRIRTFLAVKTLAEKEDVRATQDDFSRYMMLLAQREGMSQEQLKQLLRNREFVNETTYQIVRAKVLDLLTEKVEFIVNEGSVEQTNEALAALEDAEGDS